MSINKKEFVPFIPEKVLSHRKECTMNLRKELDSQLSRWRNLISQFMASNDEELEYDLSVGGHLAQDYLNLISDLQEESRHSLEIMSASRETPEELAISVKELNKINAIISRALKIRKILQKNGTINLQLFVNPSEFSSN